MSSNIFENKLLDSLYEIEYARFLDIRWLYLGYWVESSHKMNYKADFHPAQILRDSRWIPFKNQ